MSLTLHSTELPEESFDREMLMRLRTRRITIEEMRLTQRRLKDLDRFGTDAELRPEASGWLRRTWIQDARREGLIRD